MKLFKIFGGLLLLVLILIFLLKNTDEVTIDLVFASYEQVKIAFVMLGALAVGILIGYGVAVTSIISSKSEIRSFKVKNRRLSDELNDLRNVQSMKVFMKTMLEKINLGPDNCFNSASYHCGWWYICLFQ